MFTVALLEPAPIRTLAAALSDKFITMFAGICLACVFDALLAPNVLAQTINVLLTTCVILLISVVLPTVI